jgi:hypothetical protein
MADHMGNIRNYIHARSTAVDDGSGTGSTYAMVNFTPSANFEYDAFGREVRANGTTVATASTPPGLAAGTSYADALPFHFCSKFTDPETGLNYYGYRYYDPKDGRWPSRDPIEERGGLVSWAGSAEEEDSSVAEWSGGIGGGAGVGVGGFIGATGGAIAGGAPALPGAFIGGSVGGTVGGGLGLGAGALIETIGGDEWKISWKVQFKICCVCIDKDKNEWSPFAGDAKSIISFSGNNDVFYPDSN